MWWGSSWRWLSLSSQSCGNFPADFWAPEERTRIEGRRGSRGNDDFIIQQEFVRKKAVLGDHQTRRLSLPHLPQCQGAVLPLLPPPISATPKAFLSSPHNAGFHGVPAYQGPETMWDMHADNGPVSGPQGALKGSLSALTDCSVFP